MQAIVLAAGFSTRLYPLTKTFPKALLKIKNQTILPQVLDQVVKNEEITKIYLITNAIYFSHFQTFLAQKKLNTKITLLSDQSNSPENRLGAIGDLNLVIDKHQINDDLLVLASDTLTSMKIGDFIQEFRQQQTSVTALYEVKDINIIKDKLGCAEINQSSQIVNFVEKPSLPPSNLACVPHYLFKKEDLALIKEYLKTGLSTDSPGSLLSYLHSRTRLAAFIIPHTGYYYDVGTLATLNMLQKDDKIAL